jgi:hypothetical protein
LCDNFIKMSEQLDKLLNLDEVDLNLAGGCGCADTPVPKQDGGAKKKKLKKSKRSKTSKKSRKQMGGSCGCGSITEKTNQNGGKKKIKKSKKSRK